MKNLDHIKLQAAETSAIPQGEVQQLTAADIRACANGLRDGTGAHADYCADIMEHLANNMVAGEPVGELRVMGGIKSGYTYANASKYPDGTKLFVAPQEPVNQKLLAAAMLAKSKIEQDRKALHECHAHPRTGLVTDGPGLLALQEYDVVRSSLNAAIAAAEQAQQAEPVARDVLTAALNEMRDACSFAVSGDIGVKSADKVMAGVDIAAIVDRYAAQPPAVPDGYAPVPTFKLGIHGKAFDTPQTRRAYTYREQPDNIGASKLGRAVLRAASGGDNIDYGLSLLKHLQAEGFGVFELGDQQKGGA